MHPRVAERFSDEIRIDGERRRDLLPVALICLRF